MQEAQPLPDGTTDHNLEQEQVVPAAQGDYQQTISSDTQNKDISQTQTEFVSQTACILFDRLQPFHNLDEDSREILEIAARLIRLPDSGTKKQGYRIVREFIEAQTFQQLAPESQNTLAAVLSSFQKAKKQRRISKLELTPAQQRAATTVNAILHIAVGLNDSHSQKTTIQRVEPAYEGLRLVVDGPHVESDAQAAQRNARLWAKTGYPPILVMDTAMADIHAMPFPEPVECIGIEPTDTMAEAGRKVLRYHFAQMLAHEEGTRMGKDIEALHDMRVATRRMRAAFEVFGDAFSKEALKPHLRGMRATGRALGAVRDLDVFMEKGGAYLDSLPDGHQHDLDLLLHAWQEQREGARADMLAYLDSREYAVFKHNFNVFLNSPIAEEEPQARDYPYPRLVREIAPVLIYTRFAAIRAFDPFIPDASIERLHALRIEFKKLRYTIEYFREVLRKESAELINNLKFIQDHLGDLNDAQVATEILRTFIDQWESRQAALPIHERKSLEAVVSYMAMRHAERHQLMVTFPKTWKFFSRSRFRRCLALSVAGL